MNKIPVLIVDDHAVVREGFRKLLEAQTDLQIVGEAQDGRQAVTMVSQLRPEIVLMDIAMPTLNGLEATRQLLKLRPTTKVVMLSAHADEAYVTGATESGAVGFLLKHTPANEVVRAIHEVHEGNLAFSKQTPRHVTSIISKPLDRVKTPEKPVRLTSREVEVLQLIAEGKANKEAAVKLGIGIKTVEKHREHLMKKLDIHETAGLTRYAIRAGVIESSVQPTILGTVDVAS